MQDLTIRFDENTGRHLYEQIYEYIRDEIREGKLFAGEKLPSTRFLAQYLQVSRATVDLAYSQLLSEGYVESVPYKGYYVCRVEELYRLQEELSGEGDAAGAGRSPGIRPPQPERPGGTRGGERTAPEIDFSPNAIDMERFPFGTWRKITREILSGDRKELFALGEPRGDEALRQTILRYLHASRAVNASPEQVIVGAGNDYLLLLLQYILGRDIRVAFENPSYRRAYRILDTFASHTVMVASDENGMRPDSLRESGANVAYVMPAHQYPTGVVMPIGRRHELLRWADEQPGRYLIEDDYDSEFRYKGKPIPSLQSSDTAGHVIYIGTFSKAIAPAIRVSYMVLPPSLLPAYERGCGFFASTVSRIDQMILNEFIQSGAFERHLNKMRKAYKDKHDILLEELKPLQGRYTLSGEHAGLHVLLGAMDGQNEEELKSRAAGEGVRVYGLREAALVEPIPGPATLMLGYGGLSEAQIRTGIRRLCRVL